MTTLSDKLALLDLSRLKTKACIKRVTLKNDVCWLHDGEAIHLSARMTQPTLNVLVPGLRIKDTRDYSIPLQVYEHVTGKTYHDSDANIERVEFFDDGGSIIMQFILKSNGASRNYATLKFKTNTKGEWVMVV